MAAGLWKIAVGSSGLPITAIIPPRLVPKSGL